MAGNNMIMREEFEEMKASMQAQTEAMTAIREEFESFRREAQEKSESLQTLMKSNSLLTKGKTRHKVLEFLKALNCVLRDLPCAEEAAHLLRLALSFFGFVGTSGPAHEKQS